MNQPLIAIGREAGVGIVTLNRPEAMNALSIALRADFAEALRELDADDGIGAIVITGAGGKAFTAGLDLKELGRVEGAVADAVGNDTDLNPIAAIEACRKPVIAAINGIAVTGGLELALACDIRIASVDARFADTHVRVEVIPGWGLSQRLGRTIGTARALEMSLTGMFIDATTAERWGLVNHVVPLAELTDRAIALGRAIAAMPTDMVRRYKALVVQGAAMPLSEALAFEKTEAMAFNRSVKASAIEARRAAVFSGNRG